MTSDLQNNGDVHYNGAYVWIWLPGATEPVVAGRLERSGRQYVFAYGQSYLARKDAIPIYTPELPLVPGVLALPGSLDMPGCLRDAAPDAWGRRVIINRTLGLKGDKASTVELDELTYLLESGSDRIGALDFQHSATDYVPRVSSGASLEELMSSAERVEQGIPLSTDLDTALFHGSSIGGARPKALIDDGDKKYIAKFSASSDLYSVVKAEFIAMRLASLAGLDVAPVKMTRAAGKDVLLIERFDRIKSGKTGTERGWQRKLMVSALTLFGLDDMMGRYASYEDLTHIIRQRFTEPRATLEELFGRLVFNILCGNTDDHARNHAAFWNGSMLTLTPAYDICPQGRAGGEAAQAMKIRGDQSLSRLQLCLLAADLFLLKKDQARKIILRQKIVIEDNWIAVCDEARLSKADRKLLWHRQFLNSFAFEGFVEG
jgi:serine/threonine-protein kinase HipA